MSNTTQTLQSFIPRVKIDKTPESLALPLHLQIQIKIYATHCKNGIMKGSCIQLFLPRENCWQGCTAMTDGSFLPSFGRFTNMAVNQNTHVRHKFGGHPGSG